MDREQKQKIVEFAAEAGLGFVSKITEYTASGMKNLKAKELAKDISEKVKEHSKISELAMKGLDWAVVKSNDLKAKSSLVNSTSNAIPSIVVVSTFTVTLYGLQKLKDYIEEKDEDTG